MSPTAHNVQIPAGRGTVSPVIRVEPYDIASVVTGAIRLDGGAMFGVVPKVLWSEIAEADELNRIQLSTRTLVAVDRAGGRVVLVDTGCGTKWTPDGVRRFRIEFDPTAIDRHLQTLDLSAQDVTDIVVTHLHFDHNGGLTDWVDEPGGPTRLRYPNARHWVHQRHWDHARQPHFKDKGSFLKEDFDCLADADVLCCVEGDQPTPPFEGVEWFVSFGHTPYQLHPVFGVGDQKLLFAGDLVPTVAHLRLGWVMAYDVEPMRTIVEKQMVFRHGLDQGWLLALPHDPSTGGVAIEGTPERPVVARVLDL